MKTNANSVRVGNAIEYQNKLWRVVKTEHTMPGKGGAFVQMELKEINGTTKLNERFRSSVFVEVARLDQESHQYLYMDGEHMVLMNPETYEQINVHKDTLGEQAIYLQDGMTVTVESHEETVISATLPEHVTLEVVETEAVVKGQTAASSNKPAIMDNGVRVMVPPFISVGTKIIVRTIDSSYIERAKDAK